MSNRVLFIVGGFGLGNATRCQALIHELTCRGFQVDVASSGNGYWYYSQQKDSTLKLKLKDMSYGTHDGKISLISTLISLPKLFLKLVFNAFSLLKLHFQENYSLIVVDSEYALFFVKWLISCNVIALNNVFYTSQLEEKINRERLPMRLWGTRAIEKLDLFFQKLCADFCISPVF